MNETRWYLHENPAGEGYLYRWVVSPNPISEGDPEYHGEVIEEDGFFLPVNTEE